MANKHAGYIPIEFNGEEYQLRIGFDEIATADNRLGVSAVQSIGQGRFDAIKILLSVGLSNPRNSPRAVKKIGKLQGDKVGYYTNKILDALEASGIIGSQEEEESEEEESGLEYDEGEA